MITINDDTIEKALSILKMTSSYLNKNSDMRFLNVNVLRL